MSKIKLLLRGSALQLLESTVAIAAGLFTLPIMLKYLGAENYGAWVLIGGFTGLLYIFDLGFASSVTRGVAGTIALKDTKKTNSIINSALLIYTGLALIIVMVVIIAVIIAGFKTIGAISTSQLQMVIFLVGLSIAIEFPFKAFAGITTAHLRYDLVASYKIIIKLTNTGVLFYLLLNDYGLVAIATLNLATSIISNILFLYMAKRVFSGMKVSISLMDKDTIKELFHYSSWAFLVDINRLIKERIDLFFIGGYISLAAVSIYYVPLRLVEYSLLLLYKSLNLSLPILTGNSSLGDEGKFYDNLILFNRINVYFSVLTFLFFLYLGETIIFYWMGSSFDFHSAYQVLLILLSGRLSALYSNGFNTALYAKAKHKAIAYINFAEVILTATLLSLFLAKLGHGPTWAAASIAIPLIVGRIVVLPTLAMVMLQIGNRKTMLLQSYRPLSFLIIGCSLYYFYPIDHSWNTSHIYRLFALALLFLIFIYVELRSRERDYIKLGLSRFK